MADKQQYSHEYIAWLNDQADLMNQIEGSNSYQWNDPASIEKRLLEGEAPKSAPIKKQPPAQPVKVEPRPKAPTAKSNLGWIVAGYDIE